MAVSPPGGGAALVTVTAPASATATTVQVQVVTVGWVSNAELYTYNAELSAYGA
ncbi:hypothetical protein ACFYYR_16825 [Streptomyces sp. NPDC001922]|uniref:hypothetical protein n=1 Tax=Streptomyces sp. NPDC001922 TaxID=3364624 RepID=UPI00368C5888